MSADVSLLSEIKFFELLDDDERALLAGVVDAKHVNKDETLFRAGDPGDCLYVVKTGAVELFVKDTAGQKIVLTVAEAGDVFGELSMLDMGPRTATALALIDADLIVLDRDDLKLLFQKKPDSALHMLAAMGRMTRKADELLRTRVSRNPNEEIEENLTVVEKVSDWIAWFSGSMYFLASNTLWFGGWILTNVAKLTHFDPYPFPLLTMIVSLEAIFLSVFVLISQNRQAQKDRVRSDIEYDVNVKAELEITHLHEKTDRIREDLLERFERIERALAQPAKANAAVASVGGSVGGNPPPAP